MVATVNEVSRIVVFIHIDDPMTKDSEFQNRVRYGSFARKASQFDDKNRELIRKQRDGDPVTDNRFIMEIYTDRLSDFVNACVVSDAWQRSLTFQRIEYIQPPPDVLEDIDEEEVMDYTEIVHYFELKTIGKVRVRLTDLDSEEEPDDEEDDLDDTEVKASESINEVEVTDELDEDDEELSRDMDRHSSLFLPASGTVH